MISTFPMGESLDQQIKWFETIVKPWMLEQPIKYWAQHPDHWRIAIDSANWVAQAAIEEKKLNLPVTPHNYQRNGDCECEKCESRRDREVEQYLDDEHFKL